MRDYYRKKLNKLLSSAESESFVQLLWASNALISEKPHIAKKYLKSESIPADFPSDDTINASFVNKWEIETLVNELMLVPKKLGPKKNIIRRLECDDYRNIRQCAHWLRKLENKEFLIGHRNESIFVEMARIANRQFDWQRGYANIPQFYRNGFVFAQGKCASYFEDTYGISIDKFSLVGFALFTQLMSQPFVRSNIDLSEIGVSDAERNIALSLLSSPYSKAMKIANQQRKGIIHTAYRPSVLRQTPCLKFGNDRIRSPLPELILERITSGIFYDVIDGGGAIRDDYGKRFEQYCLDYMSIMLPELSWESEFSYRKKTNDYYSPDLLCIEADEVLFAFECKTTRMSHKAMFGRKPFDERGFQDLVKGVFQVWRFFSHSRRNYSGRKIADGAIGVVLTLDNWLVMAKSLQEKVLQEAEKLSQEKDVEILKIDKRPIVFASISELEGTLSTATKGTFVEALMNSSSDKYQGWRVDSIHKKILGEEKPKEKEYPFSDQIEELLPWLGREPLKRK